MQHPQHIASAYEVPYRRSGPELVISDNERIAQLRTLLDATPNETPDYRLAGVLLLLYGVPFDRIVTAVVKLSAARPGSIRSISTRALAAPCRRDSARTSPVRSLPAQPL